MVPNMSQRGKEGEEMEGAKQFQTPNNWHTMYMGEWGGEGRGRERGREREREGKGEGADEEREGGKREWRRTER